MKLLKVSISLLILPIILLVSGCTTTVTQTPTPNLPTENGPTSPIKHQETPTPAEPPYCPIKAYFDFSTVPKLGETAELTFTVEIDEIWNRPWEGRSTEDLAQSRAWIEFFWVNTRGSFSEARRYIQIPLTDVLVSGDANWEGNAIENRTIKLRNTIRLPKEGFWIIEGYFSTEKWGKPLERWRKIAVADGTSVIMNFEDIKSTPLAYLAHFPYGVAGKPPPTATHPISLELDIPKPPLVGEEVILSYRVSSPFVDAPDFYAQTRVYGRFDDNKVIRIPEADILVKGDLTWKADIKKDKPSEFTATIRFPEEGEWRIQVYGNYPTRESLSSGFSDILKITITADRSYYGWEERIIQSTQPPSPTPTTTPAPSFK